MNSLTNMQVIEAFALGVLFEAGLGLLLKLACRPAGRPLPRSTGRHRPRPQLDDAWFWEREELDEAPSPVPVDAFGFAPTDPRGVPNWQRLTEPAGLPMIGGRR